MIFYYKKDNNLELQKQDIVNDLNTQLNMQETNLKILLECLKHINDVIQNTENSDDMNGLIELLKEININLKDLRSNISELKKLQNKLETLHFDLQNNVLNDKLNEYNKMAINCKNNTCNIIPKVNKFILKYVEETSFLNINKGVIENFSEKELKDDNNCNKNNENVKQLQNTIKVEKEEIANNDTLLISEVKNKVFLPYTVLELNEKLYKNKQYNNIQEIIDSEYIIPFDRYKNSIIARFKEAYNLMRKKENASITDSLDLALELSFNSLLNPAIITACKNLDELDIYLDCLSSNELDKFKIFKIKYEVLPR